MHTLFKDKNQTVADFIWRSGETPPMSPAYGLVVNLSQGIQVDAITKEPSYWFFGETGWRELTRPENLNRVINSLVTRIDDLEAHETEVDASILDLTRRITTLEN